MAGMAFRSIIANRTLGSRVSQKATKTVCLGIFNARQVQTFSLPELPYDYGALEPAISGKIMQIHHLKQHQAYITSYNTALEHLEEAMKKGESSTVVKLQSTIKFNGGGHINHSIFWKNLAPVREGGGDPPTGPLGTAIDAQFGTLEALMQKINAEGAVLQDSGWVWLGLDKFMKRLMVETTANQYKNIKLEYLRNIWSVIN